MGSKHRAGAEKSKKIRVLVVDDSSMARELITELLESDPEIEVVGVARDGQQAIELASRLKPDLITMDTRMPRIDGLKATEQIMAYNPTPILVLTTSPFKTGTDLAFKAFEAGALDIMDKPSPERWSDLSQAKEQLIKNAKLLSKVKVITHLKGKYRESTPEVVSVARKNSTLRVIAIASSTGGPNALWRILSKFPSNLPAAIVIAQHITEGFAGRLADWLNQQSKITVKEAKEGDKLKPGLALISPTAFHMEVERGGRIRLNNSPIEGIKPSGDVLLSSVAGVYGKQAIGVVLTGMGKDGAEGIKAIKKGGGRTLAQDKESSVVFGMPKAAIEKGAVDKVVPLDEMGEKIIKLL